MLSLLLARRLSHAGARGLCRTTAPSASAGAAHRVLLLGSGNVVPPVVEHLACKSELPISVTLGSLDVAAAEQLAAGRANVVAAELDAADQSALAAAVAEHDVVVSLVPWQLHPGVAQACIEQRVDMVTTSYVSDAMQAMDADAKAAGITILNEVGLDPGIDHLGAMKIIDDVKARGGMIKSFVSFCGGLPAAEDSFVPLQYKFSWSPKGVLLAGLSQAIYREEGEDHATVPGRLFDYDRPMDLFPSLNLEGYPNRNSLVYEQVYGIEGAQTILRGTLRFAGFCQVMRAMQSIGLFSEQPAEVADGARWGETVLGLVGGAAGADPRAATAEFLANPDADADAASAERVLSTLEQLGLFSDELVPAGPTVLDSLSAQLEAKLQYGPGERDMVLLSHHFVAGWPDGTESDITSTFVRCGDPAGHTAMAETVGVPCALGVEHVLRKTVQAAGVIRPVAPELYEPLLADLAKLGIEMAEAESPRRPCN